MHRNLPLLLLQAREQVMARFRPLLNASGVTEQQWRIVRVLIDQGPLEPRQISQHCRISSPSLAGVLARMNEIKMIHRERFEHDHRRVLVSLTARSRALAAQLAPQIDAAYGEIEERIGLRASTQLYAALDELIGELG